MDKNKIMDTQINKKLLIPQLPNSNNYSNYNLPRLIATKTRNNVENNENNIINYKNISLTMTGKLLSWSLKFTFLLSRFCKIQILF